MTWRRIAGLVLGLSVLSAGCGTAAPEVQSVPEARLELLEVLPPGATRILHTRPAALMASNVLGPIAREFIGAEELDRIELRFGLRPSEIEELVFAEFGDEAIVALARITRPAGPIAEAVTSRMNTIEHESDAPVWRRAGFIGTQRREVAVLRPDVLAYGSLGPSMSGVIQRAQHGGRSVQSEQGEWLVSPGPLTLYTLRPLGIPIDTPIGLVFAQQERGRFSVDAASDQLVHLEVAFDGEFPPNARDNLGALAAAVAQSDLGRLLGFDEAIEGLNIVQEPSLLRLEANWPAGPLRAGLRRALAPNMEVLLGEGP